MIVIFTYGKWNVYIGKNNCFCYSEHSLHISIPLGIKYTWKAVSSNALVNKNTSSAERADLNCMMLAIVSDQLPWFAWFHFYQNAREYEDLRIFYRFTKLRDISVRFTRNYHRLTDRWKQIWSLAKFKFNMPYFVQFQTKRNSPALPAAEHHPR